MKRTPTTKTSAISDDAPALTQANFDRAKFRVDGAAAIRTEWQDAVREQVGKQRISITLVTPTIEHFKTGAGERGHQTLINNASRRAVEGEHLAANLRAIVQEETCSAKQSQ